MAKKNGLSREQASQLYDDLKKAMETLSKKQGMSLTDLMKQAQKQGGSPGFKLPPAGAVQPQNMETAETAGLPRFPSRLNRGHLMAVGLVLIFAASRVVVSALEAVTSVDTAHASLGKPAAVVPAQRFSKEEMTILTSLDGRRAELEERGRKLEEEERALDLKNKEYTAKLTQLREMTEMLRSERDKGDKRRNSQIEQLANVYGSMNPPEAAALIEQLDVTIALQLLQKMPEKRLAQILALMNPERALTITRLLSGSAVR